MILYNIVGPLSVDFYFYHLTAVLFFFNDPNLIFCVTKIYIFICRYSHININIHIKI